MERTFEKYLPDEAMEVQALMAKLKQTEEQKNYGSSVQFPVDPQHIGMLIGTNGNNIKKAQSLPGVQLIDIRQAKTLQNTQQSDFYTVTVPGH